MLPQINRDFGRLKWIRLNGRIKNADGYDLKIKKDGAKAVLVTGSFTNYACGGAAVAGAVLSPPAGGVAFRRPRGAVN